MKINRDDISSWAVSLTDFLPEYKAVKCYSPLQFYILSGRKTVIQLDNFEPIEDLWYAVYSPQEKKYYLRNFPVVYTLDMFLFKELDEEWNCFIVDLQKKIRDGNVYTLYTQKQCEDMTAMLERLYNGYFSNKGKLPYKYFIQIADLSLKREHYFLNNKSDTGFRTQLKIFDNKIAELWKKSYKP